jgi:catalase
VNAPINPVANFQRDGAMAVNNQGNRPNYASTIQPLTYKKNPYELSQHDQQFTGPAISDLSTVTEADFVQPRALWQKVFDDKERANYVENVSGHLGGVRSTIVRDRTLSVLCVSILPLLPALPSFF